MHAMMSDVMSGSNIAQNGFINMAPAGLAVVIAPIIAGRLSTRGNFILSTVFSAMCVAVMGRLQETLPPKSRLPASSLDFSSCNPMAFVRLFTSGQALATLTLCSGVQTFTDPRLMDETTVGVMKDLGMSDVAVQTQLLRQSTSMICGVAAGKFSINTLGRLGHTHSSNLFKLLGFLLWSQAPGNPNVMMLSQLVLCLGQRQRDGVETLITDLAVKKGIGKGLAQAYKFNFRSISNLMAPLLYANLFAIGKDRRITGLPFMGAAFVSLVAELVICTVSEGKLRTELGTPSGKPL
jgi:hypothetical protein